MAWDIDLSPNAVRQSREKMRKKKEEDRMSGFNYTIEEDGSKRYEGVPYRFNEDGTRKYFPELAPPGNRRAGNGLLGGLSTSKKGVIPGRGPNAGKTPPLVVDQEYINDIRRGQYQGPTNNPPGRMPLR